MYQGRLRRLHFSYLLHARTAWPLNLDLLSDGLSEL